MKTINSLMAILGVAWCFCPRQFFDFAYALVFGFISVCFICLNFSEWKDARLSKERGSYVPIVGGVYGCVAIYKLDLDCWPVLCWLPFLMDPGCLVVLYGFHLFLRGQLHSVLFRKDGRIQIIPRRAEGGCRELRDDHSDEDVPNPGHKGLKQHSVW